MSLSKKGIQLLRLNCCNVVIKNMLCWKKSVALVTLKVVVLNIYSYKLVLAEKICISVSVSFDFFVRRVVLISVLKSSLICIVCWGLVALCSDYALEFVGILYSDCGVRKLLLLDLTAVGKAIEHLFLSSPSLPLNSAGFVADISVCTLAVFAYIFTSGSLCL